LPKRKHLRFNRVVTEILLYVLGFQSRAKVPAGTFCKILTIEMKKNT